MPNSTVIPLEDEIGDVLEKAMRDRGLSLEEVAERSRVPASRLRDAIDYRPDLTSAELSRVAAVLDLNEVGLCALGAGRYPMPELPRLPFSVWPLRIPHGIGVANAYVVAETGGGEGVLFDTGAGLADWQASWPVQVGQLRAVFLTHVETEHAGGLREMMDYFLAPNAYVPVGACAPGGRPIGEGEILSFGALEVAVFSTPGHCPAHNCYWVRMADSPASPGLLVSGDLVFAGSAGGGYFSLREVRVQFSRILRSVPPRTVVAPGHGPMTTVENELRYNPFSA